MGRKPDSENAGVTTSRITFCDLRCEAADFAKASALDGSCRTFQSLWCGKLKRHVTKNAPCEVLYGRRRPTGIRNSEGRMRNGEGESSKSEV